MLSSRPLCDRCLRTHSSRIRSQRSLFSPLTLIIPDRRFNRIFRQHRTMYFRQRLHYQPGGLHFTGGNESSFAISVFRIFPASSRLNPLTRSLINEELAIAEPHPKVLNLTSEILPDSSTRICSFMTSPQAGAPTLHVSSHPIYPEGKGEEYSPVPTSMSCFGSDPTLRGLL